MNHFQSKFDGLTRLFNNYQFRECVCLMLLAGCADPAGTPVNLDVAQQTLTTVMDGWKEGKTPDDLNAETPSIFVQEMEWTNGAKLLDYQIVSDTEAGPNLNVRVKLKLSDADGKVTEKMVTYVVGTSPTLTVYRNLMK